MPGTFVSVGNSPKSFHRLLDEVARVADKLPQPIVVQHGRTPFTFSGAHRFEFTSDDQFRSMIEGSEVFITHAGGGSVLTALRMGKVPVVVPRLAKFGEHVDDHQVALAEEFARAGSIVALTDVKELPSAVSEAMSRPPSHVQSHENTRSLREIGAAVQAYAPSRQDGILLVTPSGGHLTETRALNSVYGDHPHHFIINAPIVQPPEMQGRTTLITLSERDWKFALNILEAFLILRKHRPKLILTTGGAFSVAFALIGKLFGIPTIYLETVGKVIVPTMTGRFMYRIADRFFYQWPNLASYFPRGTYVGIVL